MFTIISIQFPKRIYQNYTTFDWNALLVSEIKLPFMAIFAAYISAFWIYSDLVAGKLDFYLNL